MNFPEGSFQPSSIETPVRLARLEIWACRAALETPVKTSFGTMRDRPAVFIRLEDGDGAFGLGEVWCNFPGCGAEHRARLVAEELAELAFDIELRSPSELFHYLSGKSHVRALQTGEAGPYAQAIAGLDIALWDLFARKAGLPLARLLNAEASARIPAYASGIHIGEREERIGKAREAGYKAFKVKVGFDMDADIAAVNELLTNLPEGERLFSDANQAWAVEDALTYMNGVRGNGLGWIEEPMPVDAKDADWKRLAESEQVPLAGGENVSGFDDFDHVLAKGALDFIQPDAAKWGGITGCYQVAQSVLASGRTYCPHFLGGGIGLLASAHLLAAAGGPGLLEVDCNANPLRQDIWEPELSDGDAVLPKGPGLGIEELPDSVTWRATYCRDLQRAG